MFLIMPLEWLSVLAIAVSVLVGASLRIAWNKWKGRAKKSVADPPTTDIEKLRRIHNDR